MPATHVQHTSPALASPHVRVEGTRGFRITSRAEPLPAAAPQRICHVIFYYRHVRIIIQ